MLGSFGSDLFRSWSDEQRRSEIAKLIQGYRNGFPIQLLCSVAADIAGSEASAKEHFCALLTSKERKSMVKKEAGNDAELRARLSAVLL